MVKFMLHFLFLLFLFFFFLFKQLNQIDLIGFIDEMTEMSEQLAEMTHTDPDDIEILHQNENSDAEKLPVEAINDEELQMLTELLAQDIEIYNYAVDTYSEKGKRKKHEKGK